jgi:hypothetical protein
MEAGLCVSSACPVKPHSTILHLAACGVSRFNLFTAAIHIVFFFFMLLQIGRTGD